MREIRTKVSGMVELWLMQLHQSIFHNLFICLYNQKVNIMCSTISVFLYNFVKSSFVVKIIKNYNLILKN